MAASLASAFVAASANSRFLDFRERFCESFSSPRDDKSEGGLLAGSVQTPVRPGNALGRDGEVGAGADQDFFQAADEFYRAERLAFAVGRGESAQIEDGIADDLAGAVEGDVAAAVAFEELDAALGKEFGRSDYVCGFRVAA